MHFLVALGQEVDIVVKDKPRLPVSSHSGQGSLILRASFSQSGRICSYGRVRFERDTIPKPDGLGWWEIHLSIEQGSNKVEWYPALFVLDSRCV